MGYNPNVYQCLLHTASSACELVNGIFHLVSGLGTLPFTSVLTSPGPPLRPFPCGDIYTFLLQILPR